ncbi:uncharacterized protein LOC123533357 [Mercenaria mercenaria]|uniref:uncharacterized protein LOC123533357 n=1 Tax=Mercenaria mercenaria TaxID=6596 RepID=UPI00234F4BA4|nr:uncharacterized protein LOC123533357 [Mercenaria mercenaria]
MQFDHVYFKPQPKGKTNSSGQIKVSPNVLSKNKTVRSVLKVTENGSNVKNVQVVITSDLPDVQFVKDCNSVSQTNQSDSFETINVDDYDSDMLNNLNFDLLDDLENILKADTEGLTCPKDSYFQSQTGDNGLVLNESNSRGQKRKVNEIEAIVDTLTCDVPEKALSVDSDYISDVPSPYSTGSPYSVHDSGSPLTDTNIESPLAGSVWEESFTELFPDLM